jgi:hypothetical protein
VRRELRECFSGEREAGLGGCGSHDCCLLDGSGQGKLLMKLRRHILVELKTGPSRRETRPMDAIPDKASILLPHCPKQGWNDGWKSYFCAFWSQFSPFSFPKSVIKDRDSRDGFSSLKPSQVAPNQHCSSIPSSFSAVSTGCVPFARGCLYLQ